MGEDDLLVIEGVLKDNNLCQYTPVHYSEDYIDLLTDLGTDESSWKLGSRTFGISGGKYFTVQLSCTQKRIPGATRKDAISKKLLNQPQYINFGFLDKFLGVLVSHCTGHAKRVTMKDLLGHKLVHA